MSLYSREQMYNRYLEITKNWKSEYACLSFNILKSNFNIDTLDFFECQIREFRIKPNVRVLAKHYNNIEVKTDDGKTWYLMVVQICDMKGNIIEDDNYNPFEPSSTMLFGILVNGVSYAFQKQEYRDKYFEMLNAPLNRREVYWKLSGGLKSNAICIFCGEICEDRYGNSAEPVEKGRCCNICNTKYVIPARMPTKSQVSVKNEKGKEVKFEISEEARQKLEDELLKDFIQDDKKQKTKSKKELQAEETRRANKEKEKAKKEREDYYKRAGMLLEERKEQNRIKRNEKAREKRRLKKEQKEQEDLPECCGKHCGETKGLKLAMGWNKYFLLDEEMITEQLWCKDCFKQNTGHECKGCSTYYPYTEMTYQVGGAFGEACNCYDQFFCKDCVSSIKSMFYNEDDMI